MDDLKKGLEMLEEEDGESTKLVEVGRLVKRHCAADRMSVVSSHLLAREHHPCPF
jgi:hypothetical protein